MPYVGGERARASRVDLGDAADCARALGGLTEATHVFYAARYDHPEGVRESVAINTAMLKNLIDILEPVATLAHIHVFVADDGRFGFCHATGQSWRAEQFRSIGAPRGVWLGVNVPLGRR